jgi:hypothetical protein
MDLQGDLIRLREELGAAGIEHALIGGIALQFHGHARATQDLDLMVKREDLARIDEIMRRLGFRRLHADQETASFVAAGDTPGRVDFLLAHRPHALGMLARARSHAIGGESHLLVRVLEPEDLIGLKVQSSSNDPRRRRGDMADVEALLRAIPRSRLDLERIRDYFRIFDREGEWDEIVRSLDQG